MTVYSTVMVPQTGYFRTVLPGEAPSPIDGDAVLKGERGAWKGFHLPAFSNDDADMIGSDGLGGAFGGGGWDDDDEWGGAAGAGGQSPLEFFNVAWNKVPGASWLQVSSDVHSNNARHGKRKFLEHRLQ